MPVALVRAHTSGDSVTSGSTIAATVATAAVPAGNLLAVWVGCRQYAAAVTSLTKPGTETATWTKVASHSLPDASGELWIIKTTVEWTVGTTVTATFASAADRRGIILVEYSGVDAVTRGTAGSGTGTAGTASATISTGMVAGDLVLGGASMAATDFYDVIATDTDTTYGAWTEADESGLRSGFGDSQGLNLSLQHKILTSSGPQTFNAVAFDNQSGQPTTVPDVGATVVALRSTNVPPNAPALLTMTDGVIINRGITQRASHFFSDPNPDDVQSAFDLRYRLISAPTWVDVAATTFFTFYDFPPATFAAGNYERQVRTYDRIGTVGPWSPSGFFTAIDPPPGPSISYPTNGQTLDQQESVVWSSPDQDAYQVRRVADNAGAPDTATVYFDTGEVTEPDTRTLALNFETNNRTEHIQVRVKNTSLWSDYVSVTGDVSYTPPPTPVVTISAEADTASLLLTITNPAPVGAAPAAAYNDVWIDDGDGEERKVTQLAPDASWRYWTPVSRRDYEGSIRVVAVAANGTTASSS